MNFDLTVSKNSVLLMVYRWLLYMRETVLTENWFGDYNHEIRKKIAASKKVGSTINVCPIFWSILRDIFVTLPIGIGKYVLYPTLLAAMVLGPLSLLVWGGYSELAGRSAAFDWFAAGLLAVFAFAIFVALYVLRKPIFYLFTGMLVAFVYTVGAIIVVCEAIGPPLAWLGNFVFGRIPTKKESAPSGTLAVFGAWIKGQLEEHCPQATITA